MRKNFKTILGLFLSACLIIPSNANLFANEISEQSISNIQNSNAVVAQEPIYSVKDFSISKKNPTDKTNDAAPLSDNDFNKLKTLEEGTIVVKFKENTYTDLATLFGISASNEKGFHIYSNKGLQLCYQYLNGTNDKTYTSGKSNLNAGEFNTIAFKADKTNKNIKLFANGELTGEIPLNTFNFIKDIPNLNIAHLSKFQRTPNSDKNEYPFDGVIEFIDIYNIPLTDNELIDITKETFTPPILPKDALFYNGDATGSEHFRIPALYTTKQGTVVAAIDARFGGGTDSPNNLDTTVRRSADGGKTWDDATLSNNFLDFPNSGGYKGNSASFIDPVLLEDETANNGNGRLFMLVDAFPFGAGLMGGNVLKGNGFTEDGKYLKLKRTGEPNFDYIAKPNDNDGYDICTLDDTPTEYTLNGKFEVYQGETPLTVAQDTTNKQVPMNIFYNTSIFQVLKTSYLYLTHSDDQGLTWSNPTLLDGMVKDNDMYFLGVGPGTGIQLKNGEHKGRLLFPVYQFDPNVAGTNNQLNALIYSDDGGITWEKGDLVTLDGFSIMTESVPVELPDGSIMVFGRTNGGKVGQIVSTDGGATWQGSATLATIPAAYCQLSAINYSQTIDGKPALILASPSNPSNRTNGVINIGLIDENGTYEDGSKKYSIDWKYKTNINGVADTYAYSCLAELPNGDIMVFYEGNDDSKIPFTTFSIAEIKGEKVEIFSDSNIIVTKTGDTNDAKKLSDDNFNKLKELEQGTFIIKFKENSTSATGTIFGISNDANDTGFNIYSDGTRICYEFKDGKNTFTYKDARANLNKNDFNTIAFKADKRNKIYKLFSNGKIVGTIPLATYSFISNVEELNNVYLGTFKRPDGKTPYLFDGVIESINVLNTPLIDEELIKATEGTYKPPVDKEGILFYNGDITESEFFRIPALYTTKQGTVVAAIDARFSGTGDSPNNLDTAVKTSKDNGLTWTPATLPNHFDDLPDEKGHNPSTSASFIDAVILEDKEINRLFMLVDAFPSGAGLMNNNCPAGTGFNENGYLALRWNGEAQGSYTHYAIPNSNKDPAKNGIDSYIVYRSAGTTTGHTLDGKYNLYNKENAMMTAQKDTGKQIQQNVFYSNSYFSVAKTSYLYLTHSDDQGITWSDPLILNGMVKDADMEFLGTGPGSSIQLNNGAYKGRLLFPVYTYKVGASNVNGQLSSLIYSDDHGVTWHRGDSVKFDNTTSMMSESVPVEMPDGSIKLFGRTNTGKVGEATSTDGGETWQSSVVLTDIAAANCQLSVINYSRLIDDKPALIIANPSNPGNRVNGVMRIGLISEDGIYEDGSKKYSIDWNQYKLDITGTNEAYAYSSLAELANGEIMVFYEGNDLTNIPYKIYDISDFGNVRVESDKNKTLRETIQESKSILENENSTAQQIIEALTKLSQTMEKFEAEANN